jgi:hypothetical protein
MSFQDLAPVASRLRRRWRVDVACRLQLIAGFRPKLLEAPQTPLARSGDVAGMLSSQARLSTTAESPLRTD